MILWDIILWSCVDQMTYFNGLSAAHPNSLTGNQQGMHTRSLGWSYGDRHYPIRRNWPWSASPVAGDLHHYASNSPWKWTPATPHPNPPITNWWCMARSSMKTITWWWVPRLCHCKAINIDLGQFENNIDGEDGGMEITANETFVVLIVTTQITIKTTNKSIFRYIHSPNY